MILNRALRTPDIFPKMLFFNFLGRKTAIKTHFEQINFCFSPSRTEESNSHLESIKFVVHTI